MSDPGTLLVGIGAVLTPIALVVNTILLRRGQREIRREVQTGNGITIAALADRAEGRRVEADIAHDDRTSSEQGYVDRLKEHP